MDKNTGYNLTSSGDGRNNRSGENNSFYGKKHKRKIGENIKGENGMY